MNELGKISNLVAMNDSREDLSHDHPAFLLRQPDVPAQVVEELSLLAQLEHQEDVGRALEVLDQVDDVGMASNKSAKKEVLLRLGVGFTQCSHSALELYYRTEEEPRHCSSVNRVSFRGPSLVQLY